MTRSLVPLFALAVVTCAAVCQQPIPRKPAPQKPTPLAAAWWSITTDLANDSMEGRDTGTEAYERAARYVAEHFKADGLKPAGEQANGQPSYFQRVPMHQVDLDVAHSSVELFSSSADMAGRPSTAEPHRKLQLLEEVTVAPREGAATDVTGRLVFTGYGVPAPGENIRGQIAVFYNNTPAGLSAADRDAFIAGRIRSLTQAGVLAIVSIDNPAAIEPTHWPAAYARTVTIGSGQSAAPAARGPVVMRISAESAPKLFAYAEAVPKSMSFDRLLKLAEAGQPIPSFQLVQELTLHLATTAKNISSPNILAVLPGSDPTLAPEYVAVSAHLDGYGYGTPVFGDSLYNGALDDAAYVATLLQLADALRSSPPRRSLLFCIFTGEEKGLLGSVYFTEHPTVPIRQIVADFNLDQLRPIFPLKILTMEGIADSSLGESARRVAQKFNIELRPDRETERNLFRRADNYSFVRVGVPIAGFIFGYNPGTEEERIYRDWYARRYHKPQDDLQTPIDWAAAATFNAFYRALVLDVANAPARPQWNAGSAYAPAAK